MLEGILARKVQYIVREQCLTCPFTNITLYLMLIEGIRIVCPLSRKGVTTANARGVLESSPQRHGGVRRRNAQSPHTLSILR